MTAELEERFRSEFCDYFKRGANRSRKQLFPGALKYSGNNGPEDGGANKSVS